MRSRDPAPVALLWRCGSVVSRDCLAGNGGLVRMASMGETAPFPLAPRVARETETRSTVYRERPPETRTPAACPRASIALYASRVTSRALYISLFLFAPRDQRSRAGKRKAAVAWGGKRTRAAPHLASIYTSHTALQHARTPLKVGQRLHTELGPRTHGRTHDQDEPCTVPKR